MDFQLTCTFDKTTMIIFRITFVNRTARSSLGHEHRKVLSKSHQPEISNQFFSTTVLHPAMMAFLTSSWSTSSLRASLPATCCQDNMALCEQKQDAAKVFLWLKQEINLWPCPQNWPKPTPGPKTKTSGHPLQKLALKVQEIYITRS